MKYMLTLAVMMVLAAPLQAAENTGAQITKGTKSYQSARNYNQPETQGTIAAQQETDMESFDPNAVEPAAGAMEDSATQEMGDDTMLRDQMRLPRKN